jgi:hypothetical protein
MSKAVVVMVWGCLSVRRANAGAANASPDEEIRKVAVPELARNVTDG